MRTRAGIILIEDDEIALIERHRAGIDYFVFPGGGVDEGETVEQAAIRETMEELGVEVAIKRKVAEILFDAGNHFYFLVEHVAGKFGTGTGEEFTDADPNDPEEGIYIPIWMPMSELSRQEKVYPAALAKLVVQSRVSDWETGVVVIDERMK